MSEKKSRTLIYKQAKYKAGRHNLEQMLRGALSARPVIGDRRERLSPDDESPIWLVIGQHQMPAEGFVYGMLVRYAPGTNPSFIVDDASAKNLRLQHLQAPVIQGKRLELLESMLFFVILDNHVVLMQGLALRSAHLERHLQWLLCGTRVFAEDNALMLVDQVPRAAREKLNHASVKKVRIGGDFSHSSMRPTGDGQGGGRGDGRGDGARSSMQVRSTADSAGVVEHLKRLLPPSQAARLNLDDFGGSNLEYTLEISYKRQTTDDGQRFMDQLGAALRHAEDVDATLELVGGGEISKEDMRLSGKITIATVGGVPNPTDVFHMMRTWLERQVTSGEVGG